MGAKSLAAAQQQGGRHVPQSLGCDARRGELGRKLQKLGQAGPQLLRDAVAGIARGFAKYFAQPCRELRVNRHK